MTDTEKFEKDKAYNAEHQLFAPYDDDVLGKRKQGCFVNDDVDDNGDLYFRVLFDNGNRYSVYPKSGVVTQCGPIQHDVIIHKHIEKCIYDIIVDNSGVKNPRIYCCENEIESYNDNTIIIVRVVIHRDCKTVCVTNIHVLIQHKGYGKKLLSEIYNVCKKFDYKLYITEMVHSFYARMVNRGAKIIKEDDVVEITENTNLT